MRASVAEIFAADSQREGVSALCAARLQFSDYRRTRKSRLT